MDMFDIAVAEYAAERKAKEAQRQAAIAAHRAEEAHQQAKRAADARKARLVIIEEEQRARNLLKIEAATAEARRLANDLKAKAAVQSLQAATMAALTPTVVFRDKQRGTELVEDGTGRIYWRKASIFHEPRRPTSPADATKSPSPRTRAWSVENTSEGRFHAEEVGHAFLSSIEQMDMLDPRDCSHAIRKIGERMPPTKSASHQTVTDAGRFIKVGRPVKILQRSFLD